MLYLNLICPGKSYKISSLLDKTNRNVTFKSLHLHKYECKDVDEEEDDCEFEIKYNTQILPVYCDT